jgi:pimeloyl-ACP methyl ester carboxylesterase
LQGEAMRLRHGVSLQVCHRRGAHPAVVFLHGALGNRFNWRSQINLALDQGWEWLAYDLAGHGQSSSYRRYSIGRHCRDLARLLETYSIERPLLCCHSYGVPIGLELARRRPVAGLVLIAGGTHDLDPWWEKPLMRSMGAAGRHLFRLPLLQRLNRRWISRQQSPVLERFFEESPIPVSLEPYRSVEAFWGYNFHRRPAPMRWPHTPALILSGGRDPMFTWAMGEALAARFHNGCHLHLPDAGHLLMAEQTELVNRSIVAWISEQKLDQGSLT